MESAQECASGEKLIFACSGAADVGALSDRAAREMTLHGAGRMFCLAGVGGQVEGIVNKTRAASKVLAIDGCSLDCAKKCLDQAGLTGFNHVRITDLGMEKGQTPVTDENVATTVEAISPLLA